jgi:hypothetical protein
MSKIVFLDIDGVLVTPSSLFRMKSTGMKADPQAVEALNHLLGATGAHIVVSSTWGTEYELHELRAELASWGVRGFVIDSVLAVGVPSTAKHRGEEILMWLKRNEVPLLMESFVILDDGGEFGELGARLVRTVFETGLMLSHAQQAMKLLNA